MLWWWFNLLSVLILCNHVENIIHKNVHFYTIFRSDAIVVEGRKQFTLQSDSFDVVIVGQFHKHVFQCDIAGYL